MLDDGYIKIWRKIRNTFVWEDSDALKLFLHLLFEANWKETQFIFKGNIQVVKRGQLICGRHRLETETGIHESKVYRLLNIFENEQIIEQQKFSTFTLISIIKYEQYQTIEQENEQRVNSERTASEQRVNSERTHLNKAKKANKAKNIYEQFTPPTKDEFFAYCKDRGFFCIAEKAFEYYSAGNWHDSQGRKIKNWKQKLIAVWFKDENKPKQTERPDSPQI